MKFVTVAFKGQGKAGRTAGEHWGLRSLAAFPTRTPPPSHTRGTPERCALTDVEVGDCLHVLVAADNVDDQ